MNLVEIYVTNIIKHTELNGYHYIIADFDCYGHKEYQKRECLTDGQYISVLQNGYYLG